MFKLIALSNGEMTLVDEKYYLDVVNAGPWHYHQHHNNAYASRWQGKGKSRKRQKLHHFIADLMGLEYNQIDHKNGDGLDNTEENLRPATSSQNAMNRKVRSDNKLGEKGIRFQEFGYVANICVDGVNRYLGFFLTLVEAKEAYRKASASYHGEYGSI